MTYTFLYRPYSSGAEVRESGLEAGQPFLMRALGGGGGGGETLNASQRKTPGSEE